MSSSHYRFYSSEIRHVRRLRKLVTSISRSARSSLGILVCLSLLLSIGGCAAHSSSSSEAIVPGPDKQAFGTLQGAATGAGAGAVTGFQIGAPTGAGALVGAGFGAVAGGIQGIMQDQSEEQLLALSTQTRRERERAMVHEVLREQYARRLELHPTRDLFPADLFFSGDEVSLKRSAVPLITELARMNKKRVPYSRLVVTVYTKAVDQASPYAQHLSERRSREISNYLVRAGIEPRRIEARGVVIKNPVLIDPEDDPLRYNQAVELSPVDR